MEIELQKRLEKIRQLKEEFNLDQKTIAEHCEPSRTRVTVGLVLSGSDGRYLTEGNISAVEKGIERILNEYRNKLCK